MAVSLSQALIRTTTTTITSSRLLKSFNLVHVPKSRYYSTNTYFSIVSLIPDAADSSPSSPSSSISPESEALAVRIIEDAVHCIIVNRSAPEWLPFIPGASYWVPPKRRNYGVAQLLRRLSISSLDPLPSSLAWPSSAYYLPNHNHDHDDLSSEQTEVEETTSCYSSSSEDQEG